MRRDLHSVRLCFQVIVRPDPNNPKHKIQFEPKVSQVIFDKAVLEDLKIHNISATSSAECRLAEKKY